MDKLCPVLRNRYRQISASPKMLAYQHWRASHWQSARQADCHDRDIKPHCGSSNPHSCVAHCDSSGTRRSFLPRGLYDALPSQLSGCHWYATAGGHPTNLNVNCRSPPTAFWKLNFKVFPTGQRSFMAALTVKTCLKIESMCASVQMNS